MTAKPPTASGSASRRALGVALLGGATGATLILIAAGQTWAEGTASFGEGTIPLQATGSDVTGLPSALALVGLAALVAVFAVRRGGRRAVATLLALCGLGVTVSALMSGGDTEALDEQAAEGTGLVGSTADQVSHSGWLYVAALGGLLLLLAGVLALRFGGSWPAMGGRYERAGGAGRTPATRRAPRASRAEEPEELWKALDRGEDPTEPLGDSAAEAGTGPAAEPGQSSTPAEPTRPKRDGAPADGDEANGGSGTRS